MSWCKQILYNGYCPVFYVACSIDECQKCSVEEQSVMNSLADRALETGVDRERHISECEFFGRVLQGIMVGCCKDGKEVPTLILCEKVGRPVSAYTCYACANYNKKN